MLDIRYQLYKLTTVTTFLFVFFSDIRIIDMACQLFLRFSDQHFDASLTLWRRANARNVSFLTRYGGQFTFST